MSGAGGAAFGGGNGGGRRAAGGEEAGAAGVERGGGEEGVVGVQCQGADLLGEEGGGAGRQHHTADPVNSQVAVINVSRFLEQRRILKPLLRSQCN